jgi:hypothetical protein
MTKINLQKTCQLLLTLNFIFWIFIACYFSFFKYGDNDNYFFIKILLFSEPIFYLISFVGIIKKIKIIYLFSIILALGNSILSITDQIGLSDVVSLFLSLLLFSNLIFIWKNIFIKTEEIKS